MNSLSDLYNQYYSELTENDLYIFKCVIKDYAEISKLSINDFSKQIAASTSSILRFTQKIGFSGYSEFKYYLADYTRALKAKDENLNSNEILVEDLKNTKLYYEENDHSEVIRLIHKAENVFCYGTGWGQKNVLGDLSRNLIISNRFTITIPAAKELDLSSNLMTENDVLIIVSLSGNVENIEETLKYIQAKGTNVISFTNRSINLLAQIADYPLYYSSTPGFYRNEEVVMFTPMYFVTTLLFNDYLNYIKKLEMNDDND